MSGAHDGRSPVRVQALLRDTGASYKADHYGLLVDFSKDSKRELLLPSLSYMSILIGMSHRLLDLHLSVGILAPGPPATWLSDLHLYGPGEMLPGLWSEAQPHLRGEPPLPADVQAHGDRFPTGARLRAPRQPLA